jgi:hypothetical protein
MSDPPKKECPECNQEVRRLIFGGTGVIFKGSGFYVTDKGKSGKRDSQKPEEKTSPCIGCPASGDTGGGTEKCPASTEKTSSSEKASSVPPKSESKSA